MSTGHPGREGWGGMKVARRRLGQRDAKKEEEIGWILQTGD